MKNDVLNIVNNLLKVIYLINGSVGNRVKIDLVLNYFF